LEERALIALKASAADIAKESNEIGFELLGFDFMIDEDLNTYLIEVNQNPCLSTLSDAQGVLIKKLLEDTFE
jgi:glutathione synthase/RimK-type ligase-like ATP-grasp enzyme